MATLHAPLSGPSDDRYRQALHASGIGAALIDLNGHWLEVNPAFEQALGYGAHELSGHQACEFVHPDDRERARAHLAALATGDVDASEIEKRLLRRGGDVVRANARVSLLRDADGAPARLLLQLQGTEAQPLAHAPGEDPMQKQLQLFADGMAHDLRAPLRSIESFATLLDQRAGERLEAAEREYLTRIRGAASRMGGLLNGLGELARAGRAELRPQPVDMSLLAEWIAADLQDRHAGAGLQLQVQPGLYAQGDERLLRLMLEQLLDNAVKFSRDAGHARVELAGDVRHGRLRLRVRDYGSGFDARYAHKLFQPFQRLHSAERGGGHGLGLAIAQTVAQRHGGRIEACSAEPGCVFEVELPAAEAADA